MLHDTAEHLPDKIPPDVIHRIKRLEALLPPSGGCCDADSNSNKNGL